MKLPRSPKQLWLKANETLDSYTIYLVTLLNGKITEEWPLSRVYVKPESRKEGYYTITHSRAAGFTSEQADIDWESEANEPEGSRLYQLAEDALVRNSIIRDIPAVNTIIPSFYQTYPQFAPSKPKCTERYPGEHDPILLQLADAFPPLAPKIKESPIGLDGLVHFDGSNQILPENPKKDT